MSKHLVAQLQEQLNRLESTRRPAGRERTSTGCSALDRVLPAGGFARGSLVEWLGPRGGGAGTLAFLAARQAAEAGGSVVIVDRHRWFYPPAAAAWGLDPQRLIVVWPSSVREELWAVDQSLRCSAVAAVWARIEKLDQRWFRRLQLAAEEAGTLGLLLRPDRVRGQASWADAQLVVTPCCPPTGGLLPEEDVWRLRIEVTRCRGGAAGGVVELEVDGTRGEVREVTHHETLPMPVATSLARAALGHREAGA